MVLSLIVAPSLHETQEEYKELFSQLRERLNNINNLELVEFDFGCDFKLALPNIIAGLSSKYVMIITLKNSICESIDRIMKFCSKDDFNLAFFRMFRVNDKGRKIYFYDVKKTVLTKKDDFINLNLGSYVFSLSLLKRITIRDLTYDYDYFLIADAIDKCNNYLYQPLEIETKEYPETDFYNFDRQYEKDWYIKEINRYITEFKDKRQSQIIQRFIAYLLKVRLACNRNNRNKQLLNAEEVSEYLEKFGLVSNLIDDEYLIQYNLGGKSILPKYMCFYALNAKHKNNIRLTTISGKRDFYVSYNNKIIERSSNIQLDIKAINNSKDELIFDGELVNAYCLSSDKIDVVVVIDKQKILAKKLNIYTSDKYFDRVCKTGFSVQISIPKEKLKNKSKITFELRYEGAIVVLPLRFVKTAARLSNEFSHSYYIKFGFLLKYYANDCSIRLIEASAKEVARNEFLLWSDFIRYVFINDEKGNKLGKIYNAIKAIGIRSLFWISKIFIKKPIWITFDQLFKGGDNGENFFKYVCNLKEKKVNIYYIVNSSSNDFERLKREGYKNIVKFKSIVGKLMALNAQLVLATRVDVKQYLGFSNIEDVYYRNLLNYKVACLQHGLSIQEIAEYQNRLFDNTKLYFCASKYEIKNLMQKEYGYQKQSLILSGLPRYDALTSNDKRFILIAPTWRRNVTAGTNRKGETHRYSENFKYSEYFKIYNSLINNIKLIKFAQEFGYQIVYLIHPILGPQLQDFDQNEYVMIMAGSDGNVSYERILSEASLMVTDHSGIQYDFAYMKKPIVYYHPTLLPAQYMAKTMNYSEMGFGPICKDEDELVNTLIDFMKNNCTLLPEYKKRIEDFFEFDDKCNSKRIYEYLIKRLVK